MKSTTKGQDPTAWANDRKVRMERAKQIREERKNAVPDDSTFAPQINKKPSYLTQKNTASVDALDNLTAGFNRSLVSEDERPLPGNRQYDLDSKISGASPGSDALGREVKKYSPRNLPQRESPDTNKSAPTQFKTKFMQQYENDSSRLSENQPVKNADAEATEMFMSLLRSDSNKNGKSAGKGWNDDTTTNGFEDIRNKPRRQNVVEDKPQAAAVSRRPQAMRSEWNADFSQNGPQPSISPRSQVDKSRLSLLKQKIRMSESGSGSRMHSSEPAPPYGRADETIPRTAPDRGMYNGEPPVARKGQMETDSYGLRDPRYVEQRQNRLGQNMPTKPTTNSRPYEHGDDDLSVISRKSNASQTSREAAKPTRVAPAIAAPIARIQQSSKAPPQVEPTSIYAAADDGQEEIYSGPLLECPDCGRKFNPTALQKHAKICKKVFLQQRKVFDSKKMRIEGIAEENPDAANILKKALKSSAAPKQIPQQEVPTAKVRAPAKAPSAIVDPSLPKWKADSLAFREALKNGKLVTKALKEGGPLPDYVPSAPDPSLRPCPHCGRRFNDKAAERHIPLCSSIRAKPSVLKKGSGQAPVTTAKVSARRGF